MVPTDRGGSCQVVCGGSCQAVCVPDLRAGRQTPPPPLLPSLQASAIVCAESFVRNRLVRKRVLSFLVMVNVSSWRACAWILSAVRHTDVERESLGAAALYLSAPAFLGIELVTSDRKLDASREDSK